MATLTVNGKPVELERETPLAAFLEVRGISPRHIAVAWNGSVVDRGAYDAVVLRAGDTLEIVRAVGGG